MKKIFTVLILLGTLTVSAQVKIGDNPTTINANSLLELESTNKGLLIPRIALTATNNVAPFSAHTAGMLVYNTATAGTVPNNVTPGFYYNDGSSWTRVVNGPAGTSGNIYTADGTLTGNRTVTQGANTLSFTSTATNGFSVDGSTFSVDAANNAVGFGTASPNANAVVDATAVNKGVLLPRVALSATNNASPLSAFVAGMTVYNTATAGSSSTAVTPGLYYSDGTKWIPTGKDYVEDPTLGSIAVFPYNALPSGYLECNGAAVSRTTYSALFAKIGTTYGAGNGSTTFNLPDLRGEFIRGFDNGRGLDAGRTLGSNQTGATALPTTAFTVSTVAAHTHSVDPPSTTSSTDGSHSHTTGGAIANGNTNGQTGSVSGSNFGLIQRSNGSSSTASSGVDVTPDEPNLYSAVINHYHTTDAQGNHSHTVDIAAVTSSAAGGHNHTLSGGDAETRPRNVAMVYAIKAVESVLVPSSTSSAVSAAAAANEPWFKVGTSTGATSNTDNVYLMGNVGIGTSSPGGQLSNTAGSVNHLNSIGTGLDFSNTLNWRKPGGSGGGNVAQFVNESTDAFSAGVEIKTYANSTTSAALDVSRGSGAGAGSPLFTVLSTGNVGIGTNTPNAPLQFANTFANRKIVLVENLNNDHQYFGFGINNNTLRYQINTTTDSHVFYAGTSSTTSNELMRITGAGKVGIGTTSPVGQLSNFSANHVNSLWWGSSSNGLNWMASDAGNAAQFINEGTSAGAGGVAIKTFANDASTPALDVSRGAGLTAGTPLFTVLTTGNVGIGTNGPGVVLDATGSIHFADNGSASQNTQGGYLTWNRANMGGSGQGYVGFLNHQGLGGGGFVFSTTNNNSTFNELMRITGTGLVGIGTATPATRLCNTSINYANSQGNGYTTGTLHWGSSENGNIASFINTGTGPGLMVKVSSNSNTAALDVSRGSATTAGTSLFMVAGNGNVGIGTNNPGNRLEVNSGTSGASGLRFTNMNNSSASTTTNVSPLGVNASGDVVVSGNTVTYLAKGRFRFGDVAGTAAAPSLSGAFNVSSVTRPTSYLATVNFTNAVPTSAIILVQLRSTGPNPAAAPYVYNQTTTSFQIQVEEWGAVGQDIWVDFVVIP